LENTPIDTVLTHGSWHLKVADRFQTNITNKFSTHSKVAIMFVINGQTMR